MLTPISTSSTSASKPVAEKIDKPVGTGTIGASKNVSASVKMIFTMRGTAGSEVVGADSMKPPIRSTGHHIRVTHADTSLMLNVRACMASADHAGDAAVQLAREVDEHPQYPGARSEQRHQLQQQFRN